MSAITTYSTPGCRGSATLDELAESVLGASRSLVALAAKSLAEYESTVSLPQYRALVVIASRGPQRPVDLARALGVDPSTSTRMCDRLVRKRLITRRRQVTDRRIVVMDLSATGRQLVERVIARRREEIARVVGEVEPKERASLVRAFAVFGEAAQKVANVDRRRSWEL